MILILFLFYLSWLDFYSNISFSKNVHNMFCWLRAVLTTQHKWNRAFLTLCRIFSPEILFFRAIPGSKNFVNQLFLRSTFCYLTFDKFICLSKCLLKCSSSITVLSMECCVKPNRELLKSKFASSVRKKVHSVRFESSIKDINITSFSLLLISVSF